MNADTTHDTGEHGHVEAGEHGAHPSEAQYLKIALILGALTAIEVGLYYKNLGSVNNIALLVLAATKFVLVAAYFMHLKFDNRILRRFFAGGFFLAIFVYVAYLSTLNVFGGS